MAGGETKKGPTFHWKGEGREESRSGGAHNKKARWEAGGEWMGLGKTNHNR